MTVAKLRELTLAQMIPTAIADAGVSSICGMEYKSDCGTLLNMDPFRETGRHAREQSTVPLVERLTLGAALPTR